MKKDLGKLRFLPVLLILLNTVLVVFLVRLFNPEDDIKSIPYTEFIKLVDSDDVCKVVYGRNSERMTVYTHTADTRSLSEEEIEKYRFSDDCIFTTTFPAHETFRKELLEKGIVLKLNDTGVNYYDVLMNIVTLVLPLTLLFVLLRSPVFSSDTGVLGNLKCGQLVQESNVRFSDIIGHDEIIDDIRFITKLIKDPSLGNDIGIKTPKGILFSGEPGTGKTLLAKAIAGEADVPFIYLNASSLIEKYVGVGAKRVRDIFNIAKQNAPCILFIDEIDSVGSNRDNNRGSSLEHDQTINALLQEMDGFTGREGVFIIAATNRADKLDPALVRSGRFDRQITINKPRDWRVRKDLFSHYLSKFKLGDDIDIESLSKQVSGFTGADIEAICNEAGIIALMRELPYVTSSCLEEAIDKKIFKGSRSKSERFKNDKEIVAYHEAGHAVANYLLGLPISRASIIQTTSGVGGVVFGADSDSCFVTDCELRNKVKVCYAGRASEEIKFSSVTTGASSDITSATNILSAYVQRYGFESDFGLLDMIILNEQSVISSNDITLRLSSISKELYSDTVELLKNNYNLVEELAQKLLEYETMSGVEIELLFESLS